ncbi:hypothetical protein [Micromonospora sp. 067-2]|uniref:hypothetical protein n=1 Tax=Micromonospora sp. 067-2 TaxID=2789270 RepID=UPI003978D3D9
MLFEEQCWQADDASGRVIRSRYPGGNQPTDDSTYYPGQLDGPIGPIAADPTALTAHIDTTQPRFLEPTAVIRGLASLLGWRTPNQAARTAILTVLRDAPGITYHPSVTDRAGRTGIGVSATADDIRFLLILNPSTGELLAYERAALTPPADSDRNGASVDDYHLFLVHTHTRAATTPDPAHNFKGNATDTVPRIRAARWADKEHIAALIADALRISPLATWLIADPSPPTAPDPHRRPRHLDQTRHVLRRHLPHRRRQKGRRLPHLPS